MSDETTSSHQTMDGLKPGRRRLLVLWEGGMTQHDLPERGTVVLGRGAECDVRIDHTSVSRRHASLHVDAGYVLEDLDSSNGTRVDGSALAARQRVTVMPGQQIRLGATIVILPSAQSPAALPPPPPPIPNAALSPAMRALHETVALVAKGKLPVLVMGETGSGKEVIARQLHAQSPRAGGPFISLNCAAIPEASLEQELFGYERGAFAGADQAKSGLIEAAAGGTLLLDEVAELPLPTQAKLLRFIESGEILPLGRMQAKRVDVRVVASTNRNLEELVAQDRFRADFFYRLAGAKLVVPPLRERRSEIGPLARTMASVAAVEIGQPPSSLSAQAVAALEKHAWPGNVRELKNMIERAVLVAKGRIIEVEHLSGIQPSGPGQLVVGYPSAFSETAQTLPPPALPNTGDLRQDLGAIERERIRLALAQCDGNQSRAAKLLGISRRTLISRLDAHQLPRPRKKVGGAEEADDE